MRRSIGCVDYEEKGLDFNFCGVMCGGQCLSRSLFSPRYGEGRSNRRGEWQAYWKLGLANLIIVIALYKKNVAAAYHQSVTRVVLSGFIFGNLFGILYSLAGALTSLTVMALMKKNQGFSVMGVSVAGGVFHNIGQLIIAILVVENVSIAYYLPVLLIAGLVTGLIIGITANEMLKRLVNLSMGFED